MIRARPSKRFNDTVVKNKRLVALSIQMRESHQKNSENPQIARGARSLNRIVTTKQATNEGNIPFVFVFFLFLPQMPVQSAAALACFRSCIACANDLVSFSHEDERVCWLEKKKSGSKKRNQHLSRLGRWPQVRVSVVRVRHRVNPAIRLAAVRKWQERMCRSTQTSWFSGWCGTPLARPHLMALLSLGLHALSVPISCISLILLLNIYSD